MLDNLHIFYFCVRVWYFYVPLYGSDIIMMGYIVSVVILTLLDFLIILLAKKSCFIFAVEIKFIPNIFAASVELIMHCLIRDCRCWVSFSRNMTHRADLSIR